MLVQIKKSLMALLRDFKQTLMATCNQSSMVKAIWETEKGTLLRVLVRPNSKETEFIAEITHEAIHINLRGPAREGKANSELLKKLSKSLKISTADISLVSGHKSREKTLLIIGLSAEQLADKLTSVT